MRKLRQRGAVTAGGHVGVESASRGGRAQRQSLNPTSTARFCASPGRALRERPRERPESSPPPDGGGRGPRATAAAARGDAGTPGGGVSAGKTEEIKPRRALLPLPAAPPPAGAWVGGRLRAALPSPPRAGPGAVPGPAARGSQVQVPRPHPEFKLSVAGPGTGLPEAPPGPRDRSLVALGCAGKSSRCPSDPRHRTSSDESRLLLRATPLWASLLPKLTRDPRVSWYRGNPFPGEPQAAR